MTPAAAPVADAPGSPSPVADAPGSPAPAERPPLTVLIPVYNEERTIETLLRRVAEGPYPDKEVVVIDDGSTDATSRLLEGWIGRPGFRVLRHGRNRGKGAAVRTGLLHARGEVTIIQDADLEYDPADYPRLVEPILGGDAEAVYGSRYLDPARRLPWTRFRLGVAVFNGLVRLLYGRRLTDEATCYKAARTGLWRALDLRAERFELCPEMTAKLCRLGIRIVEVAISYDPRGASAGKKIGWRDAVQTVWTLLRWRLLPFGDGPRVLAPAYRTEHS
jgi:dolichol-phosphate mannosyltransferase